MKTLVIKFLEFATCITQNFFSFGSLSLLHHRGRPTRMIESGQRVVGTHPKGTGNRGYRDWGRGGKKERDVSRTGKVGHWGTTTSWNERVSWLDGSRNGNEQGPFVYSGVFVLICPTYIKSRVLNVIQRQREVQVVSSTVRNLESDLRLGSDRNILREKLSINPPKVVEVLQCR